METITVRLFLFVFDYLCVHVCISTLRCPQMCAHLHTHLWSPIDRIIYLKELE